MRHLSTLFMVSILGITSWSQCHTDVVICENAIEITELPFYDDWCTDNPTGCLDTIYLANPYSMLDPIYGCWNCINSPRWYLINSGLTGGQFTIDFGFDLCNEDTANCGEMIGYYAIFNDCPLDGGTVLSYSCNCFNPMGECWDEFGGDDSFIASSCWIEGCCGWDEDDGPFCYPGGQNITDPIPFDEIGQGEPPWNYAGTNFQVTFNADPNTEYYLCVFGSASCTNPDPLYHSFSWGCMDIVVTGTLALNTLEIGYTVIDGSPCFTTNVDEYQIERSTNLNTWIHLDDNCDTSTDYGKWYYYRAKTPTQVSKVVPYRREHAIYNLYIYQYDGKLIDIQKR